MDKKETYSQEVVRMYADEYVPAVHRIGRFTTALAFIVSFLPVIYLILIRGFAAPVSVYVDVMIAVVAYNIGAWIINHVPILRYWGLQVLICPIWREMLRI